MLGSVRILAVVAACAGIVNYLQFVSLRSVEYATEQRDSSENRVIKQVQTSIGETFTRFQPDPEPNSFDAAWQCFRGLRRDNLPDDNTPLVKSWNETGPKILWRHSLGEGYAGAIIAEGKVYVLDYIEEEDSDSLRCFSLLGGQEIWRRTYKNPIRRNHGKSRTVPAFADNIVVTLGPAAHVMAVDATSGDLLWTRDLVQQYNCEVPQWYAGQCPLIENGRVILGVGGEKILMAALDLKTGETVWEVPNEFELKMSHASVLSTNLIGQDQYVYAGIGGIAACDTMGNFLWFCKSWKPAVWAPTPVKVADNRLFLTAGYGAGSALLSVAKKEGSFDAVIEKEWKPTKGPASEQQTPLVIDGTLFIIQPKDAGALRGELVAADVESLPEVKATSGKQARFGLGPYIYVDNVFWIADDEGFLHVYNFENNEFNYITHHKVLPGVDSWGPIAYAGGIMVIRDSTSMVCIDLRSEP